MLTVLDDTFYSGVINKKVKKNPPQTKTTTTTKRDDTEEGESGERRLQSRAIIYRYCKSRAGGDVSKTKMPNRSPEGVQFYKFPQTFFIRGEWNTFSSSPSRTFKQGKVLSLEPFFNCPVKVKYEKKWQGVVMETFKQGRKT